MRRAAPLVLATLAALVALVGGLVVPASAAHRTATYLIDPAGTAAPGVFPEGVATDQHTFFVGSTTDGTIYRGRLDGDRATPFLAGGADGRTQAVGLKVDHGRLFVAGGMTGLVFVYDIASQALVGSFQVPNAADPTFVNDLAVAKDGSVYITDSLRPTLYRIAPGDYANSAPQTLEVFVDFTGTVLQYEPGFNLNGIVATRNGKYLALAQSNTAELFRLRIADRTVRQISLDGAVSGDGLVLKGRRLYAVERQGDVGYVVKIRMRGHLTQGRVVSRTTDPTFDDPTTAAFARGRLLVVNSQFGERAAGETPDPFTVSRIRLP